MATYPTNPPPPSWNTNVSGAHNSTIVASPAHNHSLIVGGQTYLSSGSHTHTLSTATAAVRKPSPFNFVNRRAGAREPDINVKMAKLGGFTRPVDNYESPSIPYFRHLDGDAAIEVFGNWNPLYAGKPKAMSLLLLEGCAGRQSIRRAGSMSLKMTGLVYFLPCLAGIRSTGFHTTAAGLELLDHWAEKFPKFKRFVAAYVRKDMRRKIVSECFDLAMGILPRSFAKIEQANKLNQIKADARSFRKMKRQEEKQKAEMERQRLMGLNNMALANQQQIMARQHYQNALNNTSTGIVSSGAFGKVTP